MAEAQAPLLFALEGSRPLGERIATRLGSALAPHEERDFGGGEHKARPLVEVAGRHAVIIGGLDAGAGGSANDKLVRLLFFIGALKDAGAERVTAVTPYLAYSRKDRRTKPRDPVSTRYLATLVEAMETDRLVTVEVHNVAAFENAFRRCRSEHVPIAGLLAGHLADRFGDQPLAVVSPDSGGAKRGELLRRVLEGRLGRPVGKALMDKHRSSGEVSGSLFAGDLSGQTAIIVDDLISSGTTILRAAAACRAAGAVRVVAAAAHGLFTADSPLFGPERPDEVIVTDTIPLAAGLEERVTVLGVGDLLGDVVARLHRGEAVSELLPYD